MRPTSRHERRTTVITDVRMSPDDEFAQRRRRYLIMMLIRALCVLGAGLTFQISLWFVLFFMVGAVSLPWIAVLVANDRPAKKAVRFRRFIPTGPMHQELTATAEPPPADAHPGGTHQPEDRAAPIRIIEL